MKLIKKILTLTLSVIALVACEKDGDLITLSSLKTNKLIATQTNVALSQSNSQKLVLALAWNTNTLTISDTTMSSTDILETTLQISTNKNFSDTIIESVKTGYSCSYTGSDLNTLAKNLKLTPDVSTPVYFRLAASVGDNMSPLYSNIVSVNITSYEIDMSVGYILDSNKDSTGITLYSANSDGEYLGFIGATSWYNYYLEEGDGAIWGNDGVSGTAFKLSSSEVDGERWNCWFPETAGCYYVDFNTNDEEWSALLLPSLTVSGDVEGTMAFDRPNNKWTLAFTATSTTMHIKISGTGNLYTSTTGTNAESAIETTVAFAPDGENLTLAKQPQNITVTVPSAGEYTLTLDLSNPKAWTLETTKGSEEPTEVLQYLYLPGVDDGISGEWTFDNYLTLYNENKLSYCGVINTNSKWGYTMNIEKNNWEDKYTSASGDAYSGTFTYKGDNNIPAPDADLYLFDVSFNDSTYALTSVGDQIYVSGLNDTWNFSITLTKTSTVGTYSGQVTINSASSSGFQVLLQSNDWTHYFGGSDGKLSYRGSNITDDASLDAGTYTLTVNLIDGTYSITQ